MGTFFKGLFFLILFSFEFAMANGHAVCDDIHAISGIESEQELQELLLEVADWGAGISFHDFAEKANCEFDAESYYPTNPSPIVFGYGVPAGPSCTLNIDVARGYVSWQTNFRNFLSKNPEGFSDFYKKSALKYGFDKYIKCL